MADHEIPWPTAGDTAFCGGRDLDDVDLSWLRLYAKDADLAEAFKAMADLAVVALETGVERSHERFFWPVAYAYRHSIELSLKTLIRQGQALDIIEDPLEHLLGKHDLGALWMWTRKVLTAFFAGDDPAPLLAAEKVVMEFHTLDRSGQEFRYTRDKKNRPHLANAPARANLVELKRVMAGVSTFLESCSSAIGMAVDDHEQMKRDYERDYEAECAREQDRSS